jgi:hypothetical protein
LSNQGYGQERPDYGSAPGQGAPYPGQGSPYPDQDARYADQGAAYGGQDARYADQDARYSDRGARYPGQGARRTDQGTAYPGQGTEAPPPALASSKGFMSSLFDFGFSSFVTPKVVKVVYVLITIVAGLFALVSVAVSFRTNVVFGIVTLFILAPLGFFIYLALWRIALEIFVVIFRISDDLRAIRDRGAMR